MRDWHANVLSRRSLSIVFPHYSGCNRRHVQDIEECRKNTETFIHIQIDRIWGTLAIHAIFHYKPCSERARHPKPTIYPFSYTSLSNGISLHSSLHNNKWVGIAWWQIHPGPGMCEWVWKVLLHVAHMLLRYVVLSFIHICFHHKSLKL